MGVGRDAVAVLTAADLVGLLAEPERLRVASAIVLGADTPAAVGAATGLEHRGVVKALQRLTAGGLVTVADGRLRLDADAFKQPRSRPPRGRRPTTTARPTSTSRPCSARSCGATGWCRSRRRAGSAARSLSTAC